MNPVKILFPFLFSLVLIGCAGNTRYSASGPGNIEFEASPASGRRPVIHIYSVDEDCRFLDYRGELALDSNTASAALPIGRVSYVNFAFAETGMMSRKDKRANTLLLPRQGQRYRLTGAFEDGSVTLKVYQREKDDSEFSEIAPVAWTREACRELKSVR